MGEKKRLRTTQWKHQQLMNSIGDLCKEHVKQNALNKEKKDGTEAEQPSEGERS